MVIRIIDAYNGKLAMLRNSIFTFIRQIFCLYDTYVQIFKGCKLQ